MLLNFQRYIAENELFNLSHKLLLAVSGGIDSVVLLDLSHKSQFQIGIAHCNFQLRDKESEQDEVFVRELAQTYQVPIYVQRFDTQALAKQNGQSIQMTARQLRYDFLGQIAQKYNYDFILTAHHQNDQIETILLNFIRGTGISGLRGMFVKQNNLIRPLLWASKEQIIDYALQNHLTWREDSSNQSTKYKRNEIRLKVLPLLKSLNPNIEQTLKENAERWLATERILQKQVQLFEKQAITYQYNQILIDIEQLLQTQEPVLFLWYVLQPYHFSYSLCKQISQSLTAQAGKTFHNLFYEVLKDRKYLILYRRAVSFTNQASEVLIQSFSETINFENFTLHLEFMPKTANLVLEKDPTTAYLDAEKLALPLKVRKWQQGDYFYPLGMKNKQKVSDFLVNNKVSRLEKNEIWVLTSQEQIVWIIGKRIDNRFAIQERTQKLVKIRVEKGKNLEL
ncbi:MAG: tRNA lysidine(34) synthetase TilS [Microscillaceae bacterium]|nr:tRNA lysidine(34) synthetase TilS [Microscillaceae bacterium]MDW8460394.1 tRNA lysidine(34) synthetase TilS [Cytophagales bacterium]